MAESTNPTEFYAGQASQWRSMAALVGHAMVYRYRSSGWRGGVLLCASVLDVLVYAIALSLVVETVFQLPEADRFVPMLIGLIALRWTLSCALQASRVAGFADICAPYYRYPILATMVLALGPPSFVFLISTFLLGAAILLTVHAPVAVFHMLGWGVFVALVQLSWNSLLVLAVILARRRGYLTSEVPIVLGFVMVLIVSPVAYQFSDIPAAASRILTSFNPASHLLAGYQNAFWHLNVVSLEVLPLSAVASVGLVVLGLAVARKPFVPEPDEADDPPILLAWNGQSWEQSGATYKRDQARVYRPWTNALPWISGYSLLRLIHATGAGHHAAQAVLQKMTGDREALQLLETQLPIMSGKNRARLSLAAVLPKILSETSKPENVVDLRDAASPLVLLDGFLDHATAHELHTVSGILAGTGARRVAVRTYRQRVAQILLEASAENRPAVDVS